MGDNVMPITTQEGVMKILQSPSKKEDNIIPRGVFLDTFIRRFNSDGLIDRSMHQVPAELQQLITSPLSHLIF